MICKIRKLYHLIGNNFHNSNLFFGGFDQMQSRMRNAFSTAVPKLTNVEQQALVAYFAFLYIVDFKPE